MAIEISRVRVVLHKNDPFTKLDVINEEGDRLHHPGFEIPRSLIPLHLRPLGSTFLLQYRKPTWEELCANELPRKDVVIIPIEDEG